MESMSLEDTAEKPVDSFELGDKLCTLPPGKANLIAGEFYLMNHSRYSAYYYVQIILADSLSKPPTPERIIVHLIPKSREDELVPR